VRGSDDQPRVSREDRDADQRVDRIKLVLIGLFGAIFGFAGYLAARFAAWWGLP
jgi:hypothetical protein